MPRHDDVSGASDDKWTIGDLALCVSSVHDLQKKKLVGKGQIFLVDRVIPSIEFTDGKGNKYDRTALNLVSAPQNGGNGRALYNSTRFKRIKPLGDLERIEARKEIKDLNRQVKTKEMTK